MEPTRLWGLFHSMKHQKACVRYLCILLSADYQLPYQQVRLCRPVIRLLERLLEVFTFDGVKHKQDRRHFVLQVK